MNWRDGESNPKILQHSAASFQRFDHGAALKIEKNVAFKHRIRWICLYRHCNALHFGNKPPGVGLIAICCVGMDMNFYSLKLFGVF